MRPTLDRGRRFLRGSPTPADAAGSTIEDVVIVLGVVEVEHLRTALEALLGDTVERPDTPARIERALDLVLARRGASGRARVLRRPAALSTPESWEIHLDGTDRASGTAVREAGRTGVLAC